MVFNCNRIIFMLLKEFIKFYKSLVFILFCYINVKIIRREFFLIEILNIIIYVLIIGREG